MEPPCKKHALVDDDWPFVFAITDLAKLVFAYVPKMQCRQFVRDSKGTLQYNICSWMPQQYVDFEIQLAILKADNALCASFIFGLHISQIVTFPLPNLLPRILLQQAMDCCLIDCFIPQCNLQWIAPQWSQPELHRNIRQWISKPKSDNGCLVYILQLLTTPLEIGDVLVCFQMERWLLLSQFVQTGLLSMTNVSNEYLAEMSPKEFCLVPKSVDGEVFAACIRKCNWNLADVLWNTTYADVLSARLTLLVYFPLDEKRVDRPQFDTNWGWNWNMTSKHEFSITQGYLCFDSALCFLTTSAPSSFTNAICVWTHKFLSKLSTKHFNRVFERACIEGHANIIKTMWHMSPPTQTLKHALAKCRFCRNRATIDFAGSIIEDDIRNDALLWIRTAFNFNNVVLWQFLFDKGILSDELLFHTDLDIFSVQGLGHKPVAMLSTIWHVPGVQDQQHLEKILIDHRTKIHENLPILRFLNAQNARLSQSALLKHLPCICAHECHNLLLQVHSVNVDCMLYWAYNNASTNIRETLWKIAPLNDPIRYLQTYDITLDMCIFLLEKQTIDAQELISRLKKNADAQKTINIFKNKTEDTTLIDEIRAYTYCKADE